MRVCIMHICISSDTRLTMQQREGELARQCNDVLVGTALLQQCEAKLAAQDSRCDLLQRKHEHVLSACHAETARLRHLLLQVCVCVLCVYVHWRVNVTSPYGVDISDQRIIYVHARAQAEEEVHNASRAKEAGDRQHHMMHAQLQQEYTQLQQQHKQLHDEHHHQHNLVTTQIRSANPHAR